MSIPSYILGQSSYAEMRLELLHELTAPPFIDAIQMLPKQNVRIINLGCGSGHLEAALSNIFSNSHFMGLDISAKRIQEAKARTNLLKSSNTIEFLEADITTFSFKNIKACDILIFRFVLSHLDNPINLIEKFLPLVKPEGAICFEELASVGTEYFCNKQNIGYQAFVEMVEMQKQAQASSFDIGFKLLSKFTHNLLHCHLKQALLISARHKSIIRLGIEDAKQTLIKKFDEKRMLEIISSLHQFENDNNTFGLYSRSVSVIAKV